MAEIINKKKLKLITSLSSQEPIGMLELENSEQVMVSLHKIHQSNLTKKDYIGDLHLLMKLNHDNILKYYGTFQDEFLVRERINGNTIFDCIHNKNNKFSLKKRLFIAMEIAKVMLFLHQMGYSHLKLTSHSIVVDWPAKQVKILDLGLFTNVINQINSSDLEEVYWRSPEFARDEERCEKTDVWSFGCILHELFFLDTPYYGKLPDEVQIFLKSGVKLSLKLDERNDIPIQIQDLLENCLKIEKNDRASFKEIILKLKKSIKMACDSYDSEDSGDSDTNDSEDSFNSKMSCDDQHEDNLSKGLDKAVNGLVDQLKTIEKKLDKLTIKSPNDNLVSNTKDNSIDESFGKLVGKLNSRPVYQGPRGGLFFLTSSYNKQYLTAPQRKKFAENM